MKKGYLTEHFSLEELTRSDAAVRLGLDNSLPEGLKQNLLITATGLEMVRRRLGGHPIQILSGYRSKAVNYLVGGSPTSDHMKALAADIVCPGFGTPLQVCRKIASSSIPIRYDQIIYEFGRWCHISFRPENEEVRNELLTIWDRETGYEQGLLTGKTLKA